MNCLAEFIQTVNHPEPVAPRPYAPADGPSANVASVTLPALEA